MKLPFFRRGGSIICRPRKGAWIEMKNWESVSLRSNGRPRKGAWIEISVVGLMNADTSRRPRKGAWIEITCVNSRRLLSLSPPQGGVD